eukprot:scaffold5826_cov291-Prasinococcus_capsulatus_cf.AAC.5
MATPTTCAALNRSLTAEFASPVSTPKSSWRRALLLPPAGARRTRRTRPLGALATRTMRQRGTAVNVVCAVLPPDSNADAQPRSSTICAAYSERTSEQVPGASSATVLVRSSWRARVVHLLGRLFTGALALRTIAGRRCAAVLLRCC